MDTEKRLNLHKFGETLLALAITSGLTALSITGARPAPSAAASPARGSIACNYAVPTESNVSLAIFDAQGHLVRTLLKDAHRLAGKNVEYWDGRDQYGQSVAPGKYQLRGIYHPPIETRYAFTIGNPGAPPWPTIDGRGDWMSDEAAAQAVVTDGSDVYLAAPGSEKGYAIIGLDPQGRRIWGYQEDAYPRCVSLALHGEYLYALFSGPELTDASRRFDGHNAIGRAFLVCLDKRTGAPTRFSLEQSDLRVATWPYTDRTRGLWDLRSQGTFTPADYEGQTRYFANDVGEPTEAVGLAAAGDRLYVSMYRANQILVLDAVSGKRLDALPLASPVGLCALPDGRLLAVSAGKVVRFDPARRSAVTLIDHALDAPHDVTVDSKGDIYVSDWGRSFQVKVFTPKGKLIRAIGNPGGRPWIGAWNPRGMLLPRGIAVTNAGELWVAEDDAQPDRVSVWSAATGAYLRDYIGPAPYGGGGAFWIDPRQESTVLADGTFFHVDYAKKTWTPLSTPFRRLSEDEPFTPSGETGPPGNRTVTHNGKQFVFLGRGEYRMVVFRRDGIRLTPVAAMGCLGRYVTTDGTDQQIWDSDIGSHRVAGYYPAFFRGHQGDNYVWSDRNGDGRVQPNEMQWAPTLPRSASYMPGKQLESCSGWSYGYGPDGAIYFRGFCRNRDVIYRLDVRGWSAAGAPEYDLAAAQPILIETTPVQGLYVDDAGRLLVARPYESNGGRDALDCYDRNGKLLWSIAKPTPAQGPDDILADTVLGSYKVPGAGTVILTWLWHGNYRPYLVTSDGIYVTHLLQDTHLGPRADWDESYRQCYQAPDGAAYLINGANDAYHFLVIEGLRQMGRFQTSLSVTEAEIKRAGSAQVAARPAGIGWQPIIHAAWNAVSPVMGGDTKSWLTADSVSFSGTKGRTARVTLQRDRTRLYLAYDVRGSRWVNRGGNWRTLFISGDCVDLMLGTGRSEPRYQAAEGDERLLIAPYQGHPIAVLYRPVAAGASRPVRLMGATIDQITRLQSAHILVRRQANGYRLEASIPLSNLGIGPDAGVVRGDVGVIYADETGSNRALRLYYYNHHTAMTSDLTTEASLQPGEWGPVEFPLGVNLLKNDSFESPFAPQATGGWVVVSARLGTATLSKSEVYAGARTLCLQQTGPVVFTAKSYNDPDYGRFIRSANGGQGGARIEVVQRVPVIGGHSYSLRIHYRLEGALGGETKNPGHPRGYDSLMVWLNWSGDHVSGHDWVANIQSDQPVWQTMLNHRAQYTLLNPPYLAPAGATTLDVSLQLIGNAEGHLPRAYFDDVELVDNGKR